MEQLDHRGKPRKQYQTFTPEGEESLTVQSDAQQADIQFIIRQYAEVGIVDNLNKAEGMFQDISEFTDFADAMRHAVMAEEEFLKLPSKIREIFDHDVGVWLDSAHDPEKRDALVAAGVIDDLEGTVEPVRSPGEQSTGGVPAAAGTGGEAAAVETPPEGVSGAEVSPKVT